MNALESQVCVIDNSKKPVSKKRQNKVIFWCKYHWKAILGELIATILLMSLGCMTCIPIHGLPAQPLYGPIGFSFIVLFNIQTFGHISGAHMNPCVTLAAVLWGKMSIALGIAYFLAQCIGSILGYGVLIALSPSDFLSKGICITQPHSSYSIVQAFGIEVILTAALLFITCSVWDPVNETKDETNSLKFGLTVTALSLAGGPLTGASMNPARSLGPALWTSMWKGHWIYWTGPFLGGTIATMIYKKFWKQQEKYDI